MASRNHADTSTTPTMPPPKDDLSTWTVPGDWPDRVPVTQAEVDGFEVCFGDAFDELFGPCH